MTNTAKSMVVLRTILRHIQNTLVLSSALLVILALQRLHHYEFRSDYILVDPQQHQQHQHQQPQQPQQPQHPQQQQHSQHYELDPEQHQHESLDNIRLDMNNQLSFGRLFEFGLFKFFLPKTETISLNEQTQSLLRHEWELNDVRTIIHYVVELDTLDNDCQHLDAIGVFAHSLQSKHVLHAILHLANFTPCNATSWLSKMRYHVIPSETIHNPNNCPELWRTYAITNLSHVDVVVRVPSTAVIRYNSIMLNTNQRRKRIKHQQEALLSTTYFSMQSIQILHPKHSVAHHRNCQSITPTICQSTSYHCQIARNTDIIFPSRQCPMPWACHSVAAINSFSSSCQAYHKLWFQYWSELKLNLKLTEDESNGSVCVNEKYQSLSELFGSHLLQHEEQIWISVAPGNSCNFIIPSTENHFQSVWSYILQWLLYNLLYPAR